MKTEKIMLICGFCNFGLQAFYDLKKKTNVDLFIGAFTNERLKELSTEIENEKIINIDLFNLQKLIDYNKKNNIKKITFAGKFDQKLIKKKLFYFSKKFPFFKCNIKDIFTLKLLIEIKAYFLIKKKILGDDSLSRITIKHLERQGTKIIPIHTLLPNLIVNEEEIEKHSSKINQIDLHRINIGFECIDSLSKFDMGQSLVMGNNKIIGIEGKEGTDELIKRCSEYVLNEKEKLILVKSNKKSQTKKIDFATIGLDTLKNIVKYKYNGIAIKKNETLIIEKDLFFTFAKKHKISIFILN